MTLEELQRICIYPECGMCSSYEDCVKNWSTTGRVPYKIKKKEKQV